MAFSEILSMPNLPIKVSMNEYIEIAKYYSTSKSKLFVNGLLDNFVNLFFSFPGISFLGLEFISFFYFSCTLFNDLSNFLVLLIFIFSIALPVDLFNLLFFLCILVRIRFYLYYQK